MDKLIEKLSSAQPDIFNCVSLNLARLLPEDEPPPESDRQLLLRALHSQVDRWRSDGIRGVACSLGLDAGSSSLIAALGSVGFRFHHAAGSACYMLLWLDDGDCNYPPYATHTIGAAGLVIRPDTGQMLVVTEAHETGHVRNWKLPGGYAHLGEDICEAAMREVREETGLETHPVNNGLLAFRHLHGHRWGIGDLYFACLLTPAPGATVRLEPGGEISDCRWLDPAEYAAQPDTSQTNRLIVDAYLRQVRDGSTLGAIGHREYLGRGQTRPSRFYSVESAASRHDNADSASATKAATSESKM